MRTNRRTPFNRPAIVNRTSRVTLLLWLLAGMVFLTTDAAVASPPLQIIRETADTLLVRFELPELQFEQLELGGQTFTQVSFKGAMLSMEAGRPRLPFYAQLIGIPADASPYVSVVNSQAEVRQTERIVPALRESIDNQPPSAMFDADDYRQDRFLPVAPVEVSPLGFIREQRVARLQINPVQYNGGAKQLRVYKELLIQVKFNVPPLAPAAPAAFAATSQPFEQLFQSRLLNYNQARAWRQYPQAIPAAPAQTIPVERYRVLVDRTDIYQVTSSELRRAGADVGGIDLKTVKMENNGKSVGVYIFDHNGDGRFDADDSIVFYGQGLIANKFTDDNVYILSWGNLDATAVKELDAAPKTPNAPTPFAFKKTEHFELNREHNRLVEVESELADHYFWTRLVGGTGNRALSEKNFPLQFPRAVPRTQINRNAEIRVKLQGASTKGNALHQARILLNGVQLGRVVEWRKQGAPLVARAIEQNRLIHPDSTDFLTVIADDQNGTPSSDADFYLDWFQIDYWRTFEALGGLLEFNSDTEPPAAGVVRYHVKNLQNQEVDVYQIRNGAVAAKLVNGQVAPNGTAFDLTFEDNVAQPTTYFVVERNRYTIARRISRANPSTLRNPSNQADYIIITHRDFMDSIKPLAAFRQSQGMSALIVDVEEIYDQFSNGLFNPIALQKFLRYAYTSWRPPKPTYVLLVGDAHYDYKKAIVKVYQQDFGGGYNLYPIYVPTFHGWSPEGGETAMDHRFVAVSGDDPLPDMFIGRLSVQFPRELDGMVKKIIDYETRRQTGPWQGRIMQVADNEVDTPTDEIFERSREELAESYIPVAYDTRKVYLRKVVSPDRTKQMILKGIEEGMLILEYSGHGGSQTWADESIFRIEDAQTLINTYLPFIVTTTCLNGQFDQPVQFGQRSLSEQLMVSRGGAVGTLSATRLTFASANAEFDKDLFTSIFSVKPATLGAIIADAKTHFMMRASDLWIPGAEQYTLFGDPATQLALPDLEIQVELEEIALDPSKELVIRQNIVGRREFSPVSGQVEFRKAADFSTNSLSALALFANDLDDDPANDRPRRRDNLQIWQGEYGTIRLSIPTDALSGRGLVRLFAFDNQRAAIGGTKFWTFQPVIVEVKEDLDHKTTNTLNLSALIADNEGPAGVKSIEVVWSDTANFVQNKTPMVLDTAAPPSTIKGASWYKLQTPIPLPKGGKSIKYQIFATDRANRTAQTELKSLRVPEGANIALASSSALGVPIRYAFSKEQNANVLIAEFVNNGGREVDATIEVWFSEGDPDRNGDNRIDSDAEILGRVVVKPQDWTPGSPDLQKATITLALDEPLSTGFHKIYVFADPEGPDDDPSDGIIGKLDEPRSFDNKGFRSLVINEFTLKPDEDLTAFSLDRVFDAFFPSGSTNGRPLRLSVNAVEPPDSFQPGLAFGPLPRVAALRSGNAFQGAYQLELQADIEQLLKPTELKIRFDLDSLKDNVLQKFGLTPGMEGYEAALKEEAVQLSIYEWQSSINAWKRLPSETLRDSKGNFILQEFVTPTQAENTSSQRLRTSEALIDPNLTPVGTWIILFLDAERYEILFQRRGQIEIEKLSRSGQVGRTFREEVFGIELNIPPPEPLAGEQPFEFGDVLTFETDLGADGNMQLSAVRNANRGNGVANVSLNLSPESKFETSDWLIFFQDGEQYELRNALNEPVRFAQGTPVKGRINQTLLIRNLGLEIFITPGDQPFAFGDKIKFSTSTVGVVAAKTNTVSTVALMATSDKEPPGLAFWVNGETPPSGSVIPPRPEISLLIEDENGIDVENFIFAVSKNEGQLERITDYTIVGEQQVTHLPIRYKPILFPGRYNFRIWLKDLVGNELGGEGGFREFHFQVVEQPDLQPPSVEIRVNGRPLADNAVLREQPQFEIQMTDDHGINPATVQLAFGRTSEALLPTPQEGYDFTFDPAQPGSAQIAFAPNLPNDEYQIQARAADTSENAAETQIYRFRLDEAVEVADVLNAPNPVRTNTFFTYTLAQAPDRVTIKIYTVSGRLVRTIADASAKRNYNETYWDARDENGTRLANGVYLYRIIVEAADKKVEKVGKLAILR